MRVARRILITLVLAGVVLPLGAGAAKFIAGDKEVTVPEKITDDLYVAGRNVLVDQEVEQDVLAGGQSVTVQSRVGGDVAAIGNLVHIKGEVRDDILAAGETVELNTRAEGDVFTAGNRVNLAQSSVINGSLYAAAQNLSLAGAVKGNVKVAGGRVLVKSDAVIEGDLVTYGQTRPVLEEGAEIQGETIHKQVQTKPDMGVVISRWVSSVVAWFLAAMVTLYAAPGLARRVVNTAANRSVPAIVTGVSWALLVIPLVILLLIAAIGLPLALLAVFMTAVFVVLAMIYAMITTGVWMVNRISKASTENITWQHVLLGAVVYQAVARVPIVGWPAAAALTVLVWGALAMAGWRMIRDLTTAARQDSKIA